GALPAEQDGDHQDKSQKNEPSWPELTHHQTLLPGCGFYWFTAAKATTKIVLDVVNLADFRSSKFSVRRTGIISALLILVFTTSVSACISGWGSPSAASCSTARSQHCPRKSSSARPACSHSVTSLPAKCSLRGFAQLHFITFHPLETCTPLRCVARKGA